MILLPTGWMALDLSIGDQINRGFESFISADGTLPDQKIALAFIAGALVAATPLHIVLRYMATLGLVLEPSQSRPVQRGSQLMKLLGRGVGVEFL